jgi:8-oxo-dGTP diphosphatase
MALTGSVRAAGGVVWRRNDLGQIDVLVVHRPKYDDWTFPKGKARRGEGDEACSLREVEEETGLVCELGEELASTSYLDSAGRTKVVRYWSMAPQGGDFSPGPEVDAVRWLSAEEAARILTHPRDRAVLDSLRTIVLR